MATSPVDVLIMTALGKELRAVLEQSQLAWTFGGDPETGTQFFRAVTETGLSVALAGPTGMGPVSSALGTTRAINALHPKTVMLTGIAAGIGESVHLGDILVSDQIVDYDLGKLRKGAYAPRWRVYQADPTLVQAARYSDPFRWSAFGQKLTSQVHVGTMLAGSKVVADAGAIDALRSTWQQAIGLEMEGGGAAAAAHEHPSRPTIIVVKAVCDHGDAQKDDSWQERAAYAAAAYALELIDSLPEQDAGDVGTPPDDEPVGPWKPDDQFAGLGLTPIELQVILRDGFSTAELMSLCVDLDIDWEDLLNTDQKTGIVASIVIHCKRRHLIKKLVHRIRQLRPNMFVDIRIA